MAQPPDSITVLSANWVIPMDGPALRDGGVAFSRGIIVAVGPRRELAARFPDAEENNLGRATLLPGLVNAHVHLELSGMSAGDRPASFLQWLKRLVPRTAPDPQTVREFTTRSVQIGVEQCMKFGVTSVGDISRQCALTRSLLKNGALRVTSYGEVQAMARRRHLLAERLAPAVDAADASDRLRIGVSPHAPYSIEAGGYIHCLEAARERGLPLATHLAETAFEAIFLQHHAGPFRELWDDLGAWDEQVPIFAGGPIRFADSLGLLDYPTLLAHVNFCDDRELSLLAGGRASVVYCPRTHAYFGHPPHRWREMLAAGINVAVGTDSCASSPDLNLVDDLRLLYQIAPDVPAEELWRMATIRAAQAIGTADRAGSLAPGKCADFAVFATRSDQPLDEVLAGHTKPTEVWIGGQCLVRKSETRMTESESNPNDK